MPKGIYAAASAMVVETHALDVAAHNLAHVQTPGFRRGLLVRSTFADALANQGRTGNLAGDGGAGVFATGVHHGFNEGMREKTGATFDLALQNAPPRPDADGRIGQEQVFYRALADDGRRLLTRASHFEIDDGGRVVTAEGWPVEGQGGEIVLPPEAVGITVDQGGRIWARMPGEDGGSETFVDQLRVFAHERPDQLTPVSGQYFDAGDEPVADAKPGFSVHQGFVERSNVDAIHELVSLITIQRRYDAAQRALSQQAETGRGLGDMIRGS
ncbi:MAG TPA: flagellar hook basal-body protein [Planctomycetota bacterium]|nr:flagellar hook basal-body protein [Planctomycetota bacterium]